MHLMMTRRAFTGLAVLGLALLAYIIILEAQGQLRAQPYAAGFSAPIAFVQDPLDRSVQFVVEQGGRIRVVREGSLLPNDFLDLRGAISAGGERGLLGMAFAPDANTGRLFVNFTNPSGNTVVARFRRSTPLAADPATRFDLRFNGAGGAASIAQPFSNHNGGHLAFGPDGYLYVGLGDGGSGDDPDHRAQNPQELLGKMLRLDVNVADGHSIGYQVPGDNPFVSGGPVAARPEIWAFGLRNPWRYSFDDPAHGGTGALVIGDVGQGAFEEIDYEPRARGGRNYGWRNREGAHDNVTSRPPAFTPLVDPIHEYRPLVGTICHRRIRLSRTRARSGVHGAVLLCRLRRRTCVVAGADDRQSRRSARVESRRTHVGARRPESAREHQLLWSGRRWRALYRQPLARDDTPRCRPDAPDTNRAAHRPLAGARRMTRPRPIEVRDSM